MLSKKCYKAKKEKPNRMSAKELKQFRTWLVNIGACQICGSCDLDYPHHVERGIYKNDFMQILLCVGCHRKIHNVTFKWHITPDQEEMKFIAKENYKLYLSK